MKKSLFLSFLALSLAGCSLNTGVGVQGGTNGIGVGIGLGTGISF